MKMDFTRKLVLSYTIVIFIFILVLLGVAYQYIVGVSEQTAAINQSQLLQKISSQVESYLDEMYNMGLMVATDTRVINMFSNIQKDQDPDHNYFDSNIMDSIDIASILSSHNAPDYHIWRISAYNQYGDYVCAGVDMENQDKNALNKKLVEFFMSELRAQEGMYQRGNDKTFLLFLPEESDTMSMLLLISNYYADEVYGVVEIQQTVEKFQEFIALEQLQETATVYLFDGDMKQVLPRDKDFQDLNQNNYYMTTKEINTYGWNLVLVSDRASMTRPYQGILGYMILFSIIIVISLVAVIYIITKRMTAPLTALSKSVKRITLDNVPSELVRDDSVDEVRELNLAFTAMLERLTKSMAYEKRAYLLALQSQMDPHFLYNILSIISGMGLESGNRDIADICSKLSAMMRYNASLDNSNVTLGDELKNAKNYLELMKIRFEDHFSYTIQLNEDLKLIKVPKQVLQPILENCFEHGFKSVPPPWRIEIKGDIFEDRWYVSISDDGIGFGSEDLDELDRKVEEYSANIPENYQELKIGGLGLVNTILRLKLFLGEGMEYCIKPNIPRGTVIILREDDKDHDKNFNC